jgi:predicted phosphodiesterase
MKFKKMTAIKVLIWIFILVVVYSFLPLVYFQFVKGASKEENNQANIEKLKKNKGVYFSFMVIGDNHSGLVFNDGATLKEIWHMNREDRFRKVPIDFVLNVGDATLNGRKPHFEAYKKIQRMIKWPLITAIGNHDNRAIFEEYCGQSRYSFADRNSFFIILDNEGGNLSDEGFQWLESQLENGKSYDHIFVVMHKPPFDPYQQDWYNMDNMPWAYKFRKLCGEYKVDMVFSGHRHMFKHEEFDGVDYLVTGGGGMLIEVPEADGGYLHYLRVTVNQDYVTYEVRRISPPVWEYLAYYFWKEAVYWGRNLYGSGYIFNRNTRIEPLRVERLNDREYWLEPTK